MNRFPLCSPKRGFRIGMASLIVSLGSLGILGAQTMPADSNPGPPADVGAPGTGFPIPTPGSAPYGLAAGPDGNLWFAEYYGNKIGRITTAGNITEFTIPTAGSRPSIVAPGPDGNVWFSEGNSNKIGRITPAGVITEFPIPTAGSLPNGIAAGPDGNLWFSEAQGHKIGRITTAGVITEFPIPTANSSPTAIAVGPDGNMWFSESQGNKIGRITPAGVVTEFSVPTAASFPNGMAAGVDGNMWFSESQGNKIGRITMAGVVTEFSVPTPSSSPWFIKPGPDGNLWFTEYYGNKVGRITTTGVVTEFTISTPNSNPAGLTAGPDGNLWFAEFSGNSIELMTTGPAACAGQPPLPAFTWSPSAPVQGQPVQFQDQSSCTPASWAWDFDGDGVTDSTAQNPGYAYANPGTYDVTLRVSNAYGSRNLNKAIVVGSTGQQPYVQNVVRDYEGFFLQGTDLTNMFHASINWQGSPGTAAFSLNLGTPVVEPGDSAGASHTYNMSADFPPRVLASTVTITPTNGNGVAGFPRTESVYVFPYPVWLQEAISSEPGAFAITIGQGEVTAEINVEFPKPHLEKLIVFPPGIPYIGGTQFGIHDTFGKISGEVSSTGVGSLTLAGQLGFEAFGSGLTGSVSGSGEFSLFPPDGLLVQGASFRLGLSGTLEKEVGLLEAIPALAALQAIPIVSWLNDHATLEGAISPSLDFTVAFAQQNGLLEFQEATGTLGLDLQVTLDVSIIKDILSAKAWVGGGGSSTLGVPVTDQDPLLRGGEIHFEAAAEFKASALFLVSSTTVKYDASCSWSPVSPLNCVHTPLSAGATVPPAENGAVSVITPDYERFGKYSAFHPTPRIRTASPRVPASVQETTLVTNVFPGASPKILAAGGGKLLLWVSQDVAQPVLQSTGISWSFDDGSGWTTPALVANDTQVELDPVAGVDANGKVVAAWLRIKDAAFSTPINTWADLPLFYTRLEVVSAVFDPASKSWGPITALTDDTALDSDLRLSADASGNLLLTWLSNAAGEFQSSSANPSTLKFALWNGSAWSAPAAIATGLIGVHSHAAARLGSTAFVILPRDPDPVTPNDGVLDLYTWNGTVWSGSAAFAAGGIENRLPSAVYDGGGTGHVVWVRGSDLVHATLSNPTPQVIRPGSDSLSFYDVQLLVNTDGNVTLLRQDSAQDGPGNIFGTIYDATSDTWSVDRQLTEDAWQAHEISAFYGTDGSIHAAYLATEITRVTQTVTIQGQPVDIPNIPVDGQTDLRLLDHTLITDLAVADSDLAVSPARPRSGVSVTATLTVHNAGDFAVGDFVVKLYVGDPAAAGVFVGTQTVIGPFVAGDRRTVSFNFIQPAAFGDLVAIVDADNAVSEFAETNNRATVYLATNTPPVAQVVASVTSGTAPLTVDFDASSSFDLDGDPISFAWTFADGTPSGAGVAVSHTFTIGGNYPVTLVASDSRGGVGNAVVLVTVTGGAPPTVSGLSPSSGPASGGTSVTITGTEFASGTGVTVGNAAAGSLVIDATTLVVTAPALTPGTLNDVVVSHPDSASGTLTQGWLADFLDVPQGDIFHDFVEEIFRHGITAGCGGGNYCRNNPVTRAQMAVFLLKSEHGSSYLPPACTGVFQDVPCPNGFAVNWIEQLYNEGITGGCSVSPRLYCPSNAVTRAQMAVFLLKAEHGSSYVPPACTGVFQDVPCPSGFAVNWIEQLYAEGVTAGCGTNPLRYCPSNPNTRGQMAVFLVKTFGLQ